MALLQSYTIATGQSINFFKSYILFSKHTLHLKWFILDMFHMQQLASFDKYLGLLVLLRHSR